MIFSIVTGTVGDEFDTVGGGIQDREYNMGKLDIGHKLTAPDVIYLPCSTVLENFQHGSTVVGGIYPFSDVSAVTVYFYSFAFECLFYGMGDQFFGVLIRAVVITTARDGYIHTVSSYI